MASEGSFREVITRDIDAYVLEHGDPRVTREFMLQFFIREMIRAASWEFVVNADSLLFHLRDTLPRWEQQRLYIPWHILINAIESDLTGAMIVTQRVYQYAKYGVKPRSWTD